MRKLWILKARIRKRATPILGLGHGVVFTDRSIFKYILENFFPMKMDAPLRL